jgi:CheY-like chemotaxis protein
MHRPTEPAESLDILVVEDEPVTRMVLRQLLEGEGYICAEAEDGRQAIDIARLRHPRLVLLDLMMPEMDGFAAAEQLRSDPRTQDIPIHCLTALDSPAVRRAAERSGFEVVLGKPIDEQSLLDVVSVTLSSSEGHWQPAG